jgi:hypothetical protein
MILPNYSIALVPKSERVLDKPRTYIRWEKPAPAVCCASAQNCIKIHKSEFLYRSNCIRSPDNREFLHEYAKIPQVQQAPRVPRPMLPVYHFLKMRIAAPENKLLTYSNRGFILPYNMLRRFQKIQDRCFKIRFFETAQFIFPWRQK